MNRRESASILMALGASPLSGFAQQPGRTYRLGMMTGNARADWARNDPYLVSFVERLGELGFAEGRNLVIEQRETGGQGRSAVGRGRRTGAAELRCAACQWP